MRECTPCCGCAHCVFYASANPSVSETRLGYHNRRRGLFRLSLKTLCYQCCKIEVLRFPRVTSCLFFFVLQLLGYSRLCARKATRLLSHLATLYKRHFYFSHSSSNPLLTFSFLFLRRESLFWYGHRLKSVCCHWEHNIILSNIKNFLFVINGLQ